MDVKTAVYRETARKLAGEPLAAAYKAVLGYYYRNPEFPRFFPVRTVQLNPRLKLLKARNPSIENLYHKWRRIFRLP